MASSNNKVKKGLEILVRSMVCGVLNLKLHLAIVEKTKLMGEHSQILEKVLLINDIQTFYHCSI